MNNVISILEAIASNATLKTTTADELQQILQAAISDPQVLMALQKENVYDLETALKTRTGLICGIMPAEEPQKQPDEQPQKQPDKEPEKQPAKEPKPTKKSDMKSSSNIKGQSKRPFNIKKPLMANVG